MRTRVLILAVPLAAAAVLATALLLRRGAPEATAPQGRAARAPAPAVQPVAAPRPPAPPLAAADAVARETEVVRLRGTYQNYRTAVATGNKALQEALLPILRKDRQAALRLAREDHTRASEPFDRDIARKIVEDLGGPP